MRIVWLTWKDGKHPLAGGAEVVNEQLAKRLVAEGHEVLFVVGGFKGGAAIDAAHGFKIVRVGNRYTLFWQAFLYFHDNLRGWADVVIEEINTAPFFSAWYTRLPKILFFHQLCREIWFYQFPAPLSFIGYFAEPLYLRLLGRSSVVTVSESVRQDLVRHGFEAQNVHIISEGITMEPLKKLDVTKYPQPTILSFGALRAMKRTLAHIEAFDLLKAHLPNAKLIVAGGSEGSYGQKVLERIAASPFKKDITCLGFVTPEKKKELMQKAHALVFTSVKEGWGLVVTEAASQGTPAVVYDVDGLRDSVQHGKTGLVTACLPAALADGLATLLQNEETYKAYQQAAWEWSKTITFDASYADFKTVLDNIPLPSVQHQTERLDS